MFRAEDGRIFANISEEEADVLRRIIAEYKQILDSEHEPGNPVIERLFPSASLDDDNIAQQFQDLTHDSLNAHKHATVAVAARGIGDEGAWDSIIDDEETEAWMTLLTDLRLTLGVSLGVDEEMMSRELDPDDPDEWPLALLHYLGALQESLVDACMRD